MKINFNKPHLTGKELEYISFAAKKGKISGNGYFTNKCQKYFENKYNFKKVLLTTSCTDALEMASILLQIKEGDEVIIPSYTFVSTANPFILRGAKVLFADSRGDHPGMDEQMIEELVTSKTKAIILVHYAGVACDMDVIMEIASKYNLFVVEDAAQAIESFYTGKDGVKRALGSIGHLAAFSFHETKNIVAGEGGMLVVNDEQFIDRAEIIWEKGTNRSSFFRGEVDKYGWVDIGSSFLPSEITAAFLWAQIENIDDIQDKRLRHWNGYFERLKDWALNNEIKLPEIPLYATNNAHMFYLITEDAEKRNLLLDKLRHKSIGAVFHYLSLHTSPFFKPQYNGKKLFYSEHYSASLLRLPLFYDLKENEIDFITGNIKIMYS